MAAGDLDEPYRSLLAHNHHMTVSMERYHGGSVDVQVLDKHVSAQHYARKILLTRRADGKAVQFGIMRINYDYLTPSVRHDVESEAAPLGRILISHDVMRKVELVSLLQFIPGSDLQSLLSLSPKQPAYGRTALIHVDGEPAVELLEIVGSIEVN